MSIVVIQARTGSRRLPGKVLLPLAGRTVLSLQLERLRHGGFEPVVATSDRPGDDPVEMEARRVGVRTHRGSENDVLARVLGACEGTDPDFVVRLTADCPFIDPAVVRDALEVARVQGADHTSNALVRTFPDGLDVEVVSYDALARAGESATRADEREHVTPYLIRRPDTFALASVVDQRNLGHERWTLDTAEDLDRIRGMADCLDDVVGDSWTTILDRVGIDAPVPHLRPALDDSHAPRTDAAARTWTYEPDGASPTGWIGIRLGSPGHATVRGTVPAARRPHAVAALRQALTADLQVIDLVVPSEWSTDE